MWTVVSTCEPCNFKDFSAMPIKMDSSLTASALRGAVERMFELSAEKIQAVEKGWKPEQGTPVFTVRGKYTARGWTEWTQGFQIGSAILQFEATGDELFLELGKRQTRDKMSPHVSHTGVHDHGFNNISTYGNLHRLMREGKTPLDQREKEFYELALKVSGAVQAARWTPCCEGGGYIYSFNGPHSLFVDTMRSLRSLALAHQLGYLLMGERDSRISLLRRLIQHAEATARYNVYYGEGRDIYDFRGRVAHESVFNVNDGSYRCPNSQQGYSPFTTWTRGLAWALLGFAEQAEFFSTLSDAEIEEACNPPGSPFASFAGTTTHLQPKKAQEVRHMLWRAATVTADYYLEVACADGIPLWDTGAPQVHRMGDYAASPSNPFNPWEPVDSSAAAVAAQGLVRLARCCEARGETVDAGRYRAAGLTTARTLLEEPYLSTQPKHQGLLLHSVYHRPNGWDSVASGQDVPNGESSLWGDYHLRELGLMLLRDVRGEAPLVFFLPPGSAR
jgi:unsaturated chondroitin disaccharide hydrolase